VYEACKANTIPVVLGGDHSIAVGSISGAARQYPDLGVLWVDAHADINTSGSTPSGNLHGMPLSFLTGLTRPIPGFEWLDMDKPYLSSDQLVYVGLRDLQEEEKGFLKAHNIKVFDMHDVDKYGIGEVMSRVHNILGDRPVHIR
jgi:arginase